MNITTMSLRQLKLLLQNKDISPTEIMLSCLENIKMYDKNIGAFITLVAREDLLSQAANSEKRWLKGQEKSPIDGIPIALKDNIHSINMPTTCASPILRNYISPFEATAVAKIKQAGGIIIGKTNLDEFAMGSTTETSFFCTTKNPWNIHKTAGGSSGGSAVAVTTGMSPLALASDTGGSVRQPASFCGIVGFKPTYGAVSRYGLVAHASSFDQIGTMAKDVFGIATLFQIIRGFDRKDATSLAKSMFINKNSQDLRGKKIAILKGQEIDSNITSVFEENIRKIKNCGAIVEEISNDAFYNATTAYYLISSAEASSNLGRYDGVKYGLRKQAETYNKMLAVTRSCGFQKEVKKRILLGTFVLSHGHRDAYYKQAQTMQEYIKQKLAEIFSDFDAIITPTTPTTAFHLGAYKHDFMNVYNADNTTVIANLAGIPAISIPCGKINNMPVGLQIMGKKYNDAEVINIAYEIEKCINQNFSPPLDKLNQQTDQKINIKKKYQSKKNDYLSSEQFDGLTKLSNIKITDKEKISLQHELAIFLENANIKNTYQATTRKIKHISNVMFEDIIKKWHGQSLQTNAPLLKETSYLVPPQEKKISEVEHTKSTKENKWEIIIGLEVHAQLKTQSKLFCRCVAAFGNVPNENTCPVCTGQPGTLPALNKEAVRMAILAGLATKAKIHNISHFARKNYFYPDCPKSYQITQFDHPICSGGFIAVENEGKIKNFRLNRIHIEEDAGKMIHVDSTGIWGKASAVDFNRAGVPLIEIVSEPDIKTAKEAKEYMIMLRTILVTLDICNGNMEQGSLRCDANISLKEKDATKLGAKVEIKNLNSFKAVERALEYEILRQKNLLEQGQQVKQETRLWNENKQQTLLMRTKEDSADYRYFLEPDLPALQITEEWIEFQRKKLPLMPLERQKKYNVLSKKHSKYLLHNPNHANYIDEVVAIFNNLKEVSNWFFSEILSHVNAQTSIHISAKDFANFLCCLETQEINGKIGKNVIKMSFETKKGLMEIIIEKNLKQITNKNNISQFVIKIINENNKQVEMYKQGKVQVFGYLIGQVMKASKGKVNPSIANKILKEKLEEITTDLE